MNSDLEDRLIEAFRAGDPGAWGDLVTLPTRRVFRAALDRIARGDFDPALVRSGFLAAAEVAAPVLADLFERDAPGADYVALTLAASRSPEAVDVLVGLLGDDEFSDLAVAGLSRLRESAFDAVADSLRGRSKSIRRDAARVFSSWHADPAWSRAVLDAWERERSAVVRDLLEPLVADANGEISSRTIAAIRRSLTAETSEHIALQLQQALYAGGREFLELDVSNDQALVAARDHLSLLADGTSGVITTWWDLADMIDDVPVKWWIGAQLLLDRSIQATDHEWHRTLARLTGAGPEGVTFVARSFATDPLPTDRLDTIVAWLAEHVTDDDIDLIAQRLISTDRERREAVRDALVVFGPPGTIAALDYLDASRVEFRSAAIEVVIAQPCRPARAAIERALDSERAAAAQLLLAEAWFEVESLFLDPSEPRTSPAWQRAFQGVEILPDDLTVVPAGLAIDSFPSIGTSWLVARLRAQASRSFDHLLATVVQELSATDRSRLSAALVPDGASSSEPWQARAWMMLSDLDGRLACRDWIDDTYSRAAALGSARVDALLNGGDLGAWILGVWARRGAYRPFARLAADAIDRPPSAPAWLAERVPTLGLDLHAKIPWKLGSRTGLALLWRNEQLHVINESGDVLKNVPNPRPDDDEDVVARDLVRLRAIREAASWTHRTFRDQLEAWMFDAVNLPPDHVRSFARHPIARDVATRVLWGMERERWGKPPTPMRLEEEGAFADLNDRQCWPTDDVRPIHPADMPGDERTAWMALFADYEIVQPFAQLSRPVFRPRPSEMRATNLRRFGSRIYDPARIRWAVWGSSWSLQEGSKLWNRLVVRRWPRWNVTAVIAFHPGFSARADDHDPEQRLDKAWIAEGIDHESIGNMPRKIGIADAPPLVFSEIVHFIATIANTLDDVSFE